MHITRLCIDGFKNLKKVDIQPDPSLNVLYGNNAQGKTNLVEAVWLCTGVRSFRGTKDRSMIDINGEVMNISLDFKNRFRDMKIEFCMAKPNIKEKNCRLNGVKLKAPSKLFGNLDCVVFTPEDLDISKGAPEKRRQFADLCVSQIKNSYAKVSSDYEQLNEQRNVLLKNICAGRSSADELEVWDVQLARMGAYISLLRYNYIKKLNIYASALYNEISGGKEKLEIKYCSTVFDVLEGRTDYKEDLSGDYLACLEKNRSEDIKAGFTLKGVHRDDIAAYIDGLPARDFASQGQHRSIALVMKLAQAYILREETDDAPVMLLDDVLSELDGSRQRFVLSKIEKMQVFITCCADSLPSDGKLKGKVFYIEKGGVTER